MFHDHQIQEAVLAQFVWEPSVNAADIGVTAKDGIVTLSGHVGTFFEKGAAEKAAARVKGVKAVVEEIEVRLHPSMVRTDEDIARAVVDRLAWEVTVPHTSIQVKVEKGWVTLSGVVEWNFQKMAAERHVRGLYGVVGVNNHVTIKPQADGKDISNNIDRALHRTWFDPKTITVSAHGGKVKLTGTVDTLGDRYVAGATAWSARGTTEVENDLIVA